MKKIIALAISLFLTTQMFAQAGRIRVTFLGFKCIRETWDDILGMDGRGDEVFFRFNVSRADQRGNVRQHFDRLTDVYGDKSGAFTNRIKAGTESPTGGIKAGDYVNTNWLLGEFDIDNGDIVTVVPTAWEQDPIADNSNAFASTVDGFVGSVNQRLAPIMIGVHILGGDFGGALFYGASLGLSATRPAGDQGELGRAGTRPIGMKKNGDFTPNVVCFNAPNLITLCNSNYGHGNGVMEVTYDEAALGNTRDHGNYTILLKYEFTPKSNPVATVNPVPPPRNTNAAPPPAPRNTNTVPPPPSNPNVSNAAPAPSATNSRMLQGPTRPRAIDPNQTVKNVANPVVAAAVIPQTPTYPADWATSVWIGSKDGQFFALRFNPPTAWILKDATNYTVEAAGSCKVSNNVLTITYYLNNFQYTLTTTNYNATTGQLSGNWQKVGTTTEQGTWIVIRKK